MEERPGIKGHGHTEMPEKSHNATQLRFCPGYNLAPAAFTLGNCFSLKCWQPIAGLKVALRGGGVVAIVLTGLRNAQRAGSGYVYKAVSRRD